MNGFIGLNEWELDIVSVPAFQRLRRGTGVLTDLDLRMKRSLADLASAKAARSSISRCGLSVFIGVHRWLIKAENIQFGEALYISRR